MPPTIPAPAVVRPAAAVNATIRALVVRASGRPWTPEERALYGLLLEEWAQAVAREEMRAAA